MEWMTTPGEIENTYSLKRSLLFLSTLSLFDPVMAAARTARVPTIKEKTHQSVAEDDQRTDGQSIREVDLDKWIPPPISWGYENLVQGAVKRFEEFLELMGPRDPRSQPR